MLIWYKHNTYFFDMNSFHFDTIERCDGSVMFNKFLTHYGDNAMRWFLFRDWNGIRYSKWEFCPWLIAFKVNLQRPPQVALLLFDHHQSHKPKWLCAEEQHGVSHLHPRAVRMGKSLGRSSGRLTLPARRQRERVEDQRHTVLWLRWCGSGSVQKALFIRK